MQFFIGITINCAKFYPTIPDFWFFVCNLSVIIGKFSNKFSIFKFLLKKFQKNGILYKDDLSSAKEAIL